MLISVKLFYWVISFAMFSTANGCGPFQAGRERTVNFTVSDFKLPPVMAYSVDPMARIKAPTISTSRGDAETFVKRLIMGLVEDVLYEQGRSAFLPDNLIDSILQQLMVQINYEPLDCDHVIDLMGMMNVGMMKNCIVVDSTVTNICMGTMDNHCEMAMIAANTKPIESKHFSISGRLKTSNAVMVNWSNQMWESVLSRVLRRITSGQYATYFYGASVRLS